PWLIPPSAHTPAFSPLLFSPFFFFNDPAPPEIYTLSLHDALPIYDGAGTLPFYVFNHRQYSFQFFLLGDATLARARPGARVASRSEEHTSELQSLTNLVCRLLLEKKNNIYTHHTAQTRSHWSTHNA